jgi:hypothetical protein
MSWILIHFFGRGEDSMDPRHQGATLEANSIHAIWRMRAMGSMSCFVDIYYSSSIRDGADMRRTRSEAARESVPSFRLLYTLHS